ncbi:MAG: YlbF family regulator [Ruminococcaceae bacterium]|nr:YlbF family regulator [Oscillospiraceae bacterium]
MADVIQLARELGAALQADARYKALMDARKVNDDDEALQKLIGDFNLIMLNAQQEAEKEDKDEAKMQAYNEQYMEAYKKIMDNENMRAYQAAQSELEAVVNTVNGIIAMSLNGEDPATCDPDAANCTHDCSSCGGCH